MIQAYKTDLTIRIYSMRFSQYESLKQLVNKLTPITFMQRQQFAALQTLVKQPTLNTISTQITFYIKYVAHGIIKLHFPQVLSMHCD